MLVQRLTHDGHHGERGASSDRWAGARGAPVLFQRGGSCYAFGRNYFCDYGAEIFMFRAPHPLGPWTTLHVFIDPAASARCAGRQRSCCRCLRRPRAPST